MKRESSKIPRVPETVPKQSKTLKILGNGKVNGLKTLSALIFILQNIVMQTKKILFHRFAPLPPHILALDGICVYCNKLVREIVCVRSLQKIWQNRRAEGQDLTQRNIMTLKHCDRVLKLSETK